LHCHAGHTLEALDDENNKGRACECHVRKYVSVKHSSHIHKLRYLKDAPTNGSWVCDSCSGHTTQRYRCSKCDYDICHTCWSAEIKAEPSFCPPCQLRSVATKPLNSQQPTKKEDEKKADDKDNKEAKEASNVRHTSPKRSSVTESPNSKEAVQESKRKTQLPVVEEKTALVSGATSNTVIVQSSQPNTASPAVTSQDPFADSLKNLRDMGFTNQELCLTYLRLKNNDVQKVVQLLLAKA
jgi:hypothetical protein